MGYSEALEAAGCKVIEFEQFGSYQGTWLALVEHDGERGIIEGAYGSCSGCDAFEAEFGWNDGEPTERDGKYYRGQWTSPDDECSKEEYDQLKEQHQQKLADFGKSYLTAGLYSRDHYVNRLASLDDDDWFDSETKEYCQWAISRLTDES